MAAARFRDEGTVGTVAVSQRNDAYTGMLIISLAAMILGCVLLLIEFLTYDSQTKPPAVALPPAPPRAAPQAPQGGAPGLPGASTPVVAPGR